ncbi:hypothetical protein [Candidatus Tisiphia endosymbiont of Stenodema calcarata]|uniref:hypothetical protein n=1 Tax=Candidatus Tisiphia endosymbiont of Stenodema calcarata TaxID=3139337 RepID=UPI003CCADD5B
MKNNMADDFDDGDKGKEEVAGSAQLENIINNIKSQMHSTNPAELERLSRDIDSFLTGNIPEKILESLKTIQAIVNERKERAEQYMLYGQEEKSREAAEEAKLQESIARLEEAANEKREAELKQHFDEYKAFQDKFDELLKEEDDLVKKAANDPKSLTTQEKAKLMGQYASEKEKEKAEKKQQEISQYWGKHYAIKDKANKSINYRKDQIKVNEAIINRSDVPESEKDKARQDNAVHNQKIKEHEENLKVLAPKEQEREKRREAILTLVNSSQPELAIEEVKKHHNRHGKEYNEARQQDPKHQGYHELHSMIMNLGGHEKLGLPKPKYPVQEQLVATAQNTKDSSVKNKPEPIKHSVEQLVATPQNTKDSSVKNKPKPIKHPVAKNPIEHALAIKESLKHQASSKKVSSAGNVNHTQAKGETQSASAKFAQRRKAMMAEHGGR